MAKRKEVTIKLPEAMLAFLRRKVGEQRQRLPGLLAEEDGLSLLIEGVVAAWMALEEPLEKAPEKGHK